LRQPTETFIARANEFNRGNEAKGFPDLKEKDLAAVYDYCLSRRHRDDATDESVVQIEHLKKSYIQSKISGCHLKSGRKGLLNDSCCISELCCRFSSVSNNIRTEEL
jgi:hypothetical protein